MMLTIPLESLSRLYLRQVLDRWRRRRGRPIVVDAFSCQGAAGRGYAEAGFDVVAVDVVDHSARYFRAVGDAGVLFVVGDAVEFLARFGDLFDARHASPPCQDYSRATAGNKAARGKHPRLIAATREALAAHPSPWVIENVEQARSELVDPVLLCGRSFGLGALDADGVALVLDRHRLFESNVPIPEPEHGPHLPANVAGVYGGSRRHKRDCPCKRAPCDHYSLADLAPLDRHAAKHVRKGGYVPRSIAVRRQLLGGVDWTTSKGLDECIPPAYALHVGRALLAALDH